jgi:hypothetical protein
MMKWYVLICISLAVSNHAYAAIIRVPQDYPTIQQGIDAAVSGDIVVVAAGTYNEEITLKAGVTVRGAGEGLSIIDGGGNSGDVVFAAGNDIDNDTKFQGFTVTGAISGGGMPGGAGIFCNSGAKPEIKNNRCEGNDFGIVTWNQASAYIHNNVVVNNNYGGIGLSTAATVINNTIVNCRIGVNDGGGYGPAVMNNIIIDNNLYGVHATGTQPVLTYNDVWNNATDYHNCSPGTGSISADPLFVDPPDDYHLDIGSPCIDTGNPATEYNDPDGTRNDMGAYGGPGAAVDFPRVELTIPQQNESNVMDTVVLAAMFNVDMNPTTINNATCNVYGNMTGLYQCTVAYDTGARFVVIEPDAAFNMGEYVTATFTRDMQSVSGDSLDGFFWQFFVRADSGSGMFDMQGVFETGMHPTSALTADFDLDGNFDVATGNSLSNDVSILLGNGDGTFQPAQDFPVGNMPRGLCTADFNNDGFLDLAASHEGSNDVRILVGHGDGTFSTGNTYAMAGYCHEMDCADLNADGCFDLVVAVSGAPCISILLGNGDGTFNSPVNYPISDGPWAVSIADFNNDGMCDIACANLGGSNVSILLGDGGGTFSIIGPYAVGTWPYSLCVSDFNGDRNLDLATVNTVSNDMTRILGNGDGTFGTPVHYPVGDEPCGVSSADLNSDGYFDIVVANVYSDNLMVFFGDGAGGFEPLVTYPVGTGPINILPADFDQDRDIDLAVTCHDVDSLVVMVNGSMLLVSETDPDQYALDVVHDTDINATFTLALDPPTLNDTTFMVMADQSGLHTGTVTYNSGTFTATFDPEMDFYDGELVSAILSHDIISQSGPVLDGFIWNFNTAVTTQSDGTFGDAQNFSTALEPRGVWAADYDADGDIDLAVTSNLNVVCILMNNGDGTYASPVQVPCSPEPIALFGADLDLDEDIDLAVVNNRPGTANLDILKNNGSGTFTVSATYTLSIMGNSIHGADFDADGDVDIVLSSYWGSSNNVDVMLNNGSGAFTGPSIYSAGTYAHGVIARDVDNDGDVDLAVASSGDDNISVLMNDGSAYFSDLVNYGVGEYPYDVYGNDLNGDGYVDIASADYSGNSVSVILNNGNGTFGGHTSYQTGANCRQLIGGDYDGDGDIDLSCCLNGEDSAAVLLNDGDGTFDVQHTYAVGSSPTGIQTGDLDLDGDLDIVCSNYNSDNVTVLYNTGSGGVSEADTDFIAPFLQVYPSPFSRSVRIHFNMAQDEQHADLLIYDVLGRIVKTIRTRSMTVVWDGKDDLNRDVANGIYFCCLQANGVNLIRQVIRVR